MVTDSISDFVIRLKNGSDAKKPFVTTNYSKFVENVAHALKKAGYISSVESEGKLFAKTLRIGLVYFSTGARINGVERISKPSRRIYRKSSEIRGVRSGFGNSFLSTPKGIMTDVEARKNKVGGEVLFKIW